MNALNPLDARYVRAESDYRAGLIRDDIVGRRARARLRHRKPRRLSSILD